MSDIDTTITAPSLGEDAAQSGNTRRTPPETGGPNTFSLSLSRQPVQSMSMHHSVKGEFTCPRQVQQPQLSKIFTIASRQTSYSGHRTMNGTERRRGRTFIIKHANGSSAPRQISHHDHVATMEGNTPESPPIRPKPKSPMLGPPVLLDKSGHYSLGKHIQDDGERRERRYALVEDYNDEAEGDIDDQFEGDNIYPDDSASNVKY